MQITIEKNVPFSGVARGKYSAAEQAIRTMAVNDSFLFPAPNVPAPLYGTASAAGVKIACRKVSDGVYRIWRIA